MEDTLFSAQHRDTELLAAMLRFEASLARAQAKAGLIPESAAQSIAGTSKIELFDVPKIVRECAQHGDLALSLVQNLKDTVAIFNQEACAYVHFECTGREAAQTAMAIEAQQFLRDMEESIAIVVEVLLSLGELHACTMVLERANFQCIGVSSLGLKCAQWAAPLARSLHSLRERSRSALCVQWGNAPGAHLYTAEQRHQVLTLVAKDLGLAGGNDEVNLTSLEDWLALASEVGILAGLFGRMGAEIACMGQQEVAEITISGAHFSATCNLAIANADSASQRVASLLDVGGRPQPEQQWQVRLAPWFTLLMSTCAVAKGFSLMLPKLTIDDVRMRQNAENLLKTLPKQIAGSPFGRNTATQGAWASKSIMDIKAFVKEMPLRVIQTA